MVIMQQEQQDTLLKGLLTRIAPYKVPLILGVLSSFLIGLSIVLLIKSIQTTTPIEFSGDNSASGSSVLGQSVIKVDIEGAVAHPGLYSLPEGSRVEDAILAAGGLTAAVDDAQFAKSINRAMKLVDGGKIFIPSHDVSLQSPQGASVQSEPGNGLVSVNTASESELDVLPGVGPVTAKKIIDNRPYQTLEELVSKKAVGAALFDKIKSQISL